MSMAVHLPALERMQGATPFTTRPKTLDARWTGDEARRFAVAAAQFVRETSFQRFVQEHRALCALAESRLQALLVKKKAHLEWFREFLGDRPGADFVVVPALLNGSYSYGASRRTAGGKEELYSVLGTWSTDQAGMPRFLGEQIETIVHSFCYWYTDPAINRHLGELAVAGESMFAAVAEKMQSMACGNWQTMLRQSLVLACVLRYTRRYQGVTAARNATKEEQQRGFAWIEGLSDLLGEYETQRDRYPSLEAFSPRLIAFFNEYAKKSAGQQAAPNAKRPKVLSMIPANGATDVEPGLVNIKVVFDRPMHMGWAMCGGGPHFPELVGKSSFDAKQTTWTTRVKLKPDWDYQFTLNAGQFIGFRSAEGVPLEEMEVTFRTKAKTRKSV